MAEGAWVPAFDSLWGSPKTLRLAKELRTSRDVAGAKFLQLMAWMRDQFPLGDLGPVDRAALARAIGLATVNVRDDEASKRGETFYQALVASRFLTDDGRGHVRGWEDGPGKLVERRATDRLRKEHAKRGAHEPPIAACPTCRSQAQQQKPITTGLSMDRSAGTPTDVRRNGQGVPTEFQRTERTGTREEREQGAPSPQRSAGPTRAAGPLRTSQEADLPDGQKLIDAASEPWASALRTIREQVSPANFVTWFQGTRLEGHDVVVCANGFVRDWLADEKRQYAGKVRAALGVERVRFVLENELVTSDEDEPAVPE